MESQGHTSDQQVAIGITSGLLVLTTFVVYLRLYIRCVLKTGYPGCDDLAIFVAWVMALGASITTFVEITSGLGRHMDELSADQLHRFNACRFAAILLHGAGLTSTKLSFLAQYYRTFDDRTIRRICLCFGFYCCLWLVVQSILYSFSCIPIQYLFPSMTETCILSAGIWTAIAMINVLTDAIIFAIPLKPLWRMSLLPRQKYLLMGVFGLGFIICIISVARIPTLRHTATSTDQTSTYAATALLSLTELELAIVCTSLPVLRPIIAHFVSGVSSPDAPSTQLGSGRKRTGGNRRRASYREEPLLTTNMSGSTVTTRSFFKSLTTRDEDRGDEHQAVLAVAETKVISAKSGQKGEKNLDSPTIVEVNYRKRDEEKRLVTPLDFFHRPSLRDGMKKPPAIVPRDLRKDGSQDSSSKASTPLTPFGSSSQSSPRRLLRTPITPLSTQLSGEDSDEPSSAHTTNSFFRPRHKEGDDFYSTGRFNHTCTPNADTLTRDVCSVCSSELLPERLRSPTQQLPELPALPSLDEQGSDAGTQTLSSRERKPSISRREIDNNGNNVVVVTTTQSTQTAIPWESSPDSSRPASPQTASESERVVVEVARQGSIARARERAMQAIADKTYGQVGEVHHGRARVVQVDTSQRRQAAIGWEEVMGLDFDQSPRRPTIKPVQSRKEAKGLSGGGGSGRPAAEVVVNKKVPVAEPELTANPSSRQQMRDGGHNESDATVTKETQPSTSQGSNGKGRTAPKLSASDKRAASTSWLRLSADFG